VSTVDRGVAVAKAETVVLEAAALAGGPVAALVAAVRVASMPLPRESLVVVLVLVLVLVLTLVPLLLGAAAAAVVDGIADVSACRRPLTAVVIAKEYLLVVAVAVAVAVAAVVSQPPTRAHAAPSA